MTAESLAISEVGGGNTLKPKELSPIDYKTQALLTFLGAFGVDDFYAGNYLQGLAKLAVSVIVGTFIRTPERATGLGATIAAMSLINLSQGNYTDSKGKVIRQVVQLKKEEISSCDQRMALILCTFLGWAGAHHFYAGKPLKGVLMLCSFGGLAIWNIVNIWQLATCGFKDGQGKTICPDYIKRSAT